MIVCRMIHIISACDTRATLVFDEHGQVEPSIFGRMSGQGDTAISAEKTSQLRAERGARLDCTQKPQGSLRCADEHRRSR